MTEALLVLYFVVLFATLIFKSRVVQGPWLFLLRAFFPNWKFFHAVGYVPHLRARCARHDECGQLVTYTMMERLVALELEARHGTHSHRQFELRMVLDDVGGEKDAYTMLQSPVIVCPGA